MSRYLRDMAAVLRAAAVTGASFAYWDGSQLHTAVAGVRNSKTGDPLTPDTVMHIGSITKLINAVLLLQLVDEGRLALDDRVIEHLPELRLRDAKSLARMTCAMLLNHTSGIDGDMLPDHGPDRERLADAIDRCAELGTIHPPGEAASYCNVGTVIAGYLVQKLRAQSWYALVQSRVYDPLGMSLALAHPTDLPRFRHCIGDVTHPLTGELIQTTRAFLPLSFAPAGATAMMTAADLVTFGRALAAGGKAPGGARILSAALCRQMTEPTAELVQPSLNVGLGWILLPGGVLTHGGSVAGGAARLYVHLHSERVVALLINCDRKHAIPKVLDPIVRSWTGQEVPAPGAQCLMERIPADQVVGVYETRLMRAEVARVAGGLTLRCAWKVRVLDNTPGVEEAPTVPLHALGEHAFEARAWLPGFPNTQIRFVRAASGQQFLATDGRLLPRTA